jgi:hypothetical protein
MVAQAGPLATARRTGVATGPGRSLSRWLRGRARRSEVPVGAVPALAAGERLLAVEVDGHRLPVAATDRAIYHGDGGGGWRRLGWEQVGRVDWDGRRDTLLLWGLTPDVPRCTRLVVRRGSGLAALARERVGWCTLVTSPIRLDGIGVVLTVRRQPGSGRLVWLVRYDVDGDDQVTSVRLASALRRVRAEVGI